MRCLSALLLVAWFGSAATAAAEVQLTMRDGRVTLKASNATVAEILAEWATVGQTQIVNSEMTGGELISIELMDLPEVEALDLILHSVAGYVATLRSMEMADRSRIGRIVILPTSKPATVAASAAPSLLPESSRYSQYPEYPQYPASPPDVDGDSLELAQPNPRGTVASPYPAYPQAASNSSSTRDSSAPARSRTPGQTPTGTSVPGMPVQAAPQNPRVYPAYPIPIQQN